MEPGSRRACHAVRENRDAFNEMGIVRLEAGIFSDNPASMRVREKCGFIREAVHKKAITKNGRLLDEVVYVRFAEEK